MPPTSNSSAINQKVLKVYYKNCRMMEFPSWVFTTFPTMEFLSISNTQLNNPELGALDACGNLKYLDISRNNVTELPAGVYQHCQHLEVTDITQNPIIEIDGDFVRSLPALEQVIIDSTLMY